MDDTQEVSSKDLDSLMTKAKQIIEGQASYSTNRTAYLEAVIDNQISLAYEMKDILEDVDADE